MLLLLLLFTPSSHALILNTTLKALSQIILNYREKESSLSLALEVGSRLEIEVGPSSS
jgi:hypothetical protein